MKALIDFENVASGAFGGIENLSENDQLIIFYSENASHISLSAHQKLEMSKTKKEYISIKTGGKNALDFQLSTYLGYLIAKSPHDTFYIISNDTGFDVVIQFWKDRNINIARCSDLNLKIALKLDENITQLLPKYNKLQAKNIAAIIAKYKTKQGIHNALVKEFGAEETAEIYKSIKPFLKNKKG